MPQARRVALVSGGSRGLGAELVSGFLERQYGVATLSRTKTTFITDMLRARKRRNFHWRAVDGRDHEALRAFVKEAGEQLGRIDVLVNNAGIAMEGILPTMRMRDIVEAIEVNLTAALVLAQACSRFMLRQGAGCIVNVSSVHAWPSTAPPKRRSTA
jgi:3-oxoacyl-[acyl-carrier protein] reductase